MAITWSIDKYTQSLRAVLFASLAVAIAAMMAAPPASAETIDRSTLPAAGATATPAVAEQPPAEPQESATPEAGSTAPEPVATDESPVVSPPPAPPVEGGPEARPEGGVTSSARSSVADAPVPTASSADAVARATEIADSATKAVKVDAPAEVDPGAAAIPVVKREASRLTEAAGRNLDETIAPRALDQVRETGASALERGGLLDLQPADLLDAVASAPAILTGPPAGEAPQASGGSRPDQAIGFLPERPRTSLLSQPGAAVPGPGGYLAPQAGEYQALPSAAETAGILTSRSGNLASISAARALGASFAGTAARHGGGPAPADVPQAPGSPASAVSDAGGPSFSPIVALLALLALAAPAALRRLGRTADFHPPIPFVCALERPG